MISSILKGCIALLTIAEKYNLKKEDYCLKDGGM